MRHDHDVAVDAFLSEFEPRVGRHPFAATLETLVLAEAAMTVLHTFANCDRSELSGIEP